MDVETEISLLDEILDPWKSQIGKDFAGYKNHVTRMLNFCFCLAQPNAEERKKLIIAAAFHDIGIWSDNTFDYLPPSVVRANIYLQESGLEKWQEEIGQMIDDHHKIRSVKGGASRLVEVFRKADLVDFSLGLIKNGVPKHFVKKVKAALPNAGFHKCLVALTWRQIKQHPFNLAPMMKW